VLSAGDVGRGKESDKRLAYGRYLTVRKAMRAAGKGTGTGTGRIPLVGPGTIEAPTC
jgi:hypothetical protein